MTRVSGVGRAFVAVSSGVFFELFFVFLAFVAVVVSVAFVVLVFGVSEQRFFRAASENTEQGRLPRKQ